MSETTGRPIKNRLLELCKSKGIRQADLADRIGAAQSTISQIITGDRIPSHDVLAAICDHFGVEVGQVIYRDKSVPLPPKKH